MENILWLNTVTGGANAVQAQDGPGISGTTGFSDALVRDYVKLFVDHGQNEYISGSPTYVVNITIRKYTDATTFTTIPSVDLTINLDVTNAIVFTDIHEYSFNGFYKIRAIVNSVKDAFGSTITYSTLPFSLGLAAGIEIERYMDFDPDNFPGGFDFRIQYETDEYEDNYRHLILKNFYIPGAFAYDIEWTYSNTYTDVDLETELTAANVEYWFHNNSTRIRVYNDEPIAIPATFDKGYITARVRGIGKDPSDLTRDVYGIWSLTDHYDDGDFYKKKISDIGPDQYFVIIGNAPEKPVHESNKNWFFQATFAEEGKMKNTITYYDGTLRSRQMVTQMNTTNESFITETFYDHQGRAAVQSLPGPAPDNLSEHPNKEIKYYENYNLGNDPVAAHEKYNRNYFDKDDGDPCEPNIIEFDIESGVAQYYSANNPRDGGQNAFIPDAEGYTFVLTEFTPDNTGRISRQAGVGPQHHLNSGHVTQYYYATPEQWELDRLFGNNIGLNTHYQKNAVVDPNGQISVSYLDMRGNVIATALAGEPPSNMDYLKADGVSETEYEESATEVDHDILNILTLSPHGTNNELVNDNKTYQVVKRILVTDEGNQLFEYSAEDLNYDSENDLCLNELCLDCVYDLHISLIDNCGIELLNSGDGLTYTIGDIPLPDGTSTSLTCADYGYDWSETVLLEVGTYDLVKTITINEAAVGIYADLYIEHIIDIGDEECVKPLDYYLDDLEALIELSCNFSCEDCQDVIEESDFITKFSEIDFEQYEASTVTEMFETFKAQCESLCPIPSNNYCDIGYTMMLADMRPNGQYGEYKDIATGAIDVEDFLLSIFNESNVLQERDFASPGPNLPNWRDPISFFGGTWHKGYFDLEDEPSLIEVLLIDDILNIYDPQVVDDGLVDLIDGKYMTPPENLESVEDFIYAYQSHPEWAKSLVAYHPEFFYYAYCSLGYNCTATVATLSQNTYEFDAWLLSLPYDDPDLSDYDGIQFMIDIDGLPSAAIDNIIAMDPLFNGATDCYDFTGMDNTSYYDISSSDFDGMLTNYALCHVSPTYYDIWEVVNLIQNEGADLGAPAASCYSPAIGEEGTDVIDNEEDWRAFVTLYISAKQKYLKVNSNMYALAAFDDATFADDYNFYNGCIGNTEYDIWWEDDATGFTEFMELTNDNCLCNFYRYPLLSQKEARFGDIGIEYEIEPDATIVELEAAAAELIAEADYSYYDQTGSGNMPLSLDIMNFLNGLLYEPSWSTLTISNFETQVEGISSRLYDFLTLTAPDGLDLTELDPTISTTIIEWEDITDPILTLEITGDDDPNPLNIYDWNYDEEKFLVFKNMIVTDAGLGQFTMEVEVLSPDDNIQTLTLEGETAIKTNDESFLTDAVTCDLSPEMGTLVLLMNYLKEDANFDATSEYDLISIENDIVESTLISYLGEGPYFWIHSGGDGEPYILYNDGDTKRISIYFSTDVDSYESFNSVEPFGPDMYTGIVGTFSGLGVPTAGDDEFISGFVDWYNFYDTETQPFPVGSCEYPVNDPCDDQEVYNAIDLLAFLQELVNGSHLTDETTSITSEPTYTSRLKMLTGYDGAGAVSWDRVTYSADGKTLTSEFNTGEEEDYCYVTLSIDNPAITFTLADIESVSNLVADYTYSTTDFAYHFTLDGVYSGNSYTIHGFISCVPLKNCFCGCIPDQSNSCSDPVTITLGFLNQYNVFVDAETLDEDFTGYEEESTFPTVFIGIMPFVITIGGHQYSYFVDHTTIIEEIVLDPTFDFVLLACTNEIEDPDGLITDFVYWTLGVDATHPYSPGVYCTIGDEISPPPCLEAAGVADEGTLEADCDPNLLSPFPPLEDPTDCEDLLTDLVNDAAQYAYENQIEEIKAAFIANFTAHCMDNLEESFHRTYTSSEYHYTLYYYDLVNNLTMTVPPKGVKKLTGTQITYVQEFRNGIGSAQIPHHTYKTQYHYNSLNQLIWQETPDAGISQFWYDRLGRLVLSQNQKQNIAFTYVDDATLEHTVEKYSYTAFDELGRIKEVGELYALEDAETDEFFYTDLNDFDVYPIGIALYRSQVTETYYNNPFAFGTSPFGIDGQENLRNRIAYVTIEEVYDYSNTTYDFATHYSYDIHGNVKTMVQDNESLNSFGAEDRYKLINYQYDLISGNVNLVSYQPGKEDQFYHRYRYDGDNRLRDVFTSRNNIIWEKDARYFYYRHGPLGRTEIGDLKIQGIDYAYTIQGWLKGVNASALNTGKDMGKDARYAGPLSSSNSYIGSDAYGFILDYYKGDYNRINTGGSAPDFIADQESGGTYFAFYDDANTVAPDLWNGNIRGMSTALMDDTRTKVDVLGKSYYYDQLNRLKQSYSFIKSGMHGTGNFSWTGVSSNNRWNTEYTYDENGNIRTMKRSGNTGTNYDMDRFTYHYYPGNENSNRLQYVEDNATGTYSEDIDDQEGLYTGDLNYVYDEIGNLIKDESGGLDEILWTVYGKISQITKSDGTVLNFAYDPMGNRIMKSNDPTSGDTEYTYYIRDAQGNVMATYDRVQGGTDKIYLSEHHEYGSKRLGYVEYTNFEMVNATPSETDFKRELGRKRFELSNHLGNVLVIVTDRRFAIQETTTGYTQYSKYYEPDVISAQDYDPFGMVLVGRTWQAGSQHRYGFNGKENEDAIVGNYMTIDFGNRLYDPRLGRWYTTDPADGLNPFESPYMFAGNNPIFYIDYEGKWKVRFADNNDHSKGIVLEAEKDDNLETLATQMGIAYENLVNENFNGKDWSKGLQLEGKWLRAEDLPGVEAFKEINDYLAREDIEQTNCSNCVMGINGFDQVNAWPIIDDGGEASTNAMANAENKIESEFVNISEAEAQFGDVITYKSSTSSAKRSGDLIDYANYLGIEINSPEYETLVKNSIEASPISHYSVVLLKTPNGDEIQQVFEKPGSTPAKISNYPPKSDGSFTPSPSNTNNSGIESPVYTKKPN